MFTQEINEGDIRKKLRKKLTNVNQENNEDEQKIESKDEVIVPEKITNMVISIKLDRILLSYTIEDKSLCLEFYRIQSDLSYFNSNQLDFLIYIHKILAYCAVIQEKGLENGIVCEEEKQYLIDNNEDQQTLKVHYKKDKDASELELTLVIH